MDFTQSCASTDPGISLFTMDESQSNSSSSSVIMCSSSSTDESSSSSNSSMQDNDAKQILHNTQNNTNNNASSVSLRQQVMLNQFVSITGCTYEQALQLLISSDWQYQVRKKICL